MNEEFIRIFADFIDCILFLLTSLKYLSIIIPNNFNLYDFYTFIAAAWLSILNSEVSKFVSFVV